MNSFFARLLYKYYYDYITKYVYRNLCLIFIFFEEKKSDNSSITRQIIRLNGAMTRWHLNYSRFSRQLRFAGCGIPVVSKQIAQRRIVGGDDAGFGSFPWQVRQGNNAKLFLGYFESISLKSPLALTGLHTNRIQQMRRHSG